MPPTLLRGAVFPLLLFFLGGCASYHAAPLDSQTVRDGLQPPSLEAVRIAAGKLDHPLLAPLVFDPTDGLSPDEAAVLAVFANPELRTMRSRLGVAGAELVAAGVLPNPQLSASSDIPRHDETGATTGTSLGLSLDLNALFTRGARKASARAQRASVSLDLAWQEWQIAQETRLQVYRQVYLDRQRALAQEEEDALQGNLNTLNQAADKQLVTEAERAAAAEAYRAARSTRLELQAACDSGRQALNRILGEPPQYKLALQTTGVFFLSPTDSGGTQDVPGDLKPLMETPPDSLVAQLERRRLDLVALRMGYQSQEQALHAAILSRFPRINIGINRVIDTSNVLTLGPAVTLDLPIFDRNQGEVRVARATRAQLRDEYLARVFGARADVADLVQQMTHTRDLLTNAELALPELDHLVAVYQNAMQLGNVDALVYYEARTKRNDMELAALRLRETMAELSVGLETATGGYWSFVAKDRGDR